MLAKPVQFFFILKFEIQPGMPAMPRHLVLRTEEITLKINRNTASYRWFDKNGKLLLQEAEKDSRSLEKFDVLKTTYGVSLNIIGL